jgi:hypothetical protein
MRCLRIYATPDGESHFGDAEIPTTLAPFIPGEAPFGLSASYPASGVRFVHVPAGFRETGFHTAPGRVLAVRLDGVAEFETSDGETRRVPAGGARAAAARLSALMPRAFRAARVPEWRAARVRAPADNRAPVG